MAKKNFVFQNKDKITLGKLIFKLRKEKKLSLRKLAITLGLSPSNLSYIENGINVPTAEIYKKIINILNPTTVMHKKLDKLYTTIRNTPPPDVCEILLQNSELSEKIRLLANVQLSSQQLENIEELFVKFKINADRIYQI